MSVPEPPSHPDAPVPALGTEPASPTTTAAPPSSGPRHAAKKTRRRFWPRTRWVQVVTVIGIVVVLIVGSFAGYLYWQSTRIHHIEVKGLSKDLAGVNKGTENILMVGSTDRCALKVQNPIYGLCSEGVTGINSDVVLILHLDWTHTTMSDRKSVV